MIVIPAQNGSTVLKKSKSTTLQRYRMVGVLIPHYLASHLVLYSLLTGTTRTKIIRAFLQQWHTTQMSKTSTKRLALDLAHVYQIRWSAQSSKTRDFSEFTKKIQQDLLRLGVEQQYIDLILSNLNQ